MCSVNTEKLYESVQLEKVFCPHKVITHDTLIFILIFANKHDTTGLF